jgi:hypothetical protein
MSARTMPTGERQRKPTPVPMRVLKLQNGECIASIDGVIMPQFGLK